MTSIAEGEYGRGTGSYIDYVQHVPDEADGIDIDNTPSERKCLKLYVYIIYV